MTNVYYVAGVVGDTESSKSNPHGRIEEHEDTLPDNEVHNGIIGVDFHTYGDSLTSAFLQVYGLDETEVTKKWYHIARTANVCLSAWWETIPTKLGVDSFRSEQ